MGRFLLSALEALAKRPSREQFRLWLSYLVVGLVGYLMAVMTAGQKTNRITTKVLHRVLLGSSHEEGVEEEEEEGEEGEEHGEEHEVDLDVDVTVIACIVLFLILLTIGFEALKEYLEESASRAMAPIIEKLFGELTVLGFLSIFTFVFTQSGFFETISEAVFGEGEELLEVFEFVHYTIFFVMCFFVVQVLVLVEEAMETEAEWHEYEKMAQDKTMESTWQERMEKYYEEGRSTLNTTLCEMIPGFRNQAQQQMDDQVLFKALRDEFILERSMDVPFEPAKEESRVDPHFNFARYLGINLGNLLAHVVELSITTWTILALLTVVYYLFCLLVREDMMVLSWSWVGIGWLVLISNIFFERHLTNLRKAFTRKEVFLAARVDNNSAENLTSDETTYLNQLQGSAAGSSALPDWCSVDLDSYMDKRPWYAKMFVGGKPNRQESLFWMDRKGPKAYMLMLQINLVFVGLYTAMLILLYIGHMWRTQHIAVFISYLVLAALPIFLITFFKRRLVAILSQVTGIGTHRKPNFVADVLREEKTARVVRAFIVIYRMRRFAAQAGTQERKKGVGEEKLKEFDPIEIREVGKTFDAFDSSKDGMISYDEFESLMSKLGAGTSPENLKKMIAMLDEDGDGQVSRDEFILWYAEHSDEVDEWSAHHRANYIFRLFDTNDSGEITICEFKHKLDALDVGFTVDEVGAIVNELDEDNNGAVGLHEFEELLEKYYPKELVRATSSHLGG